MSKAVPKPTSDRRTSKRVNYRSQGNLVTPSGDWFVYVINLSINGALIALIETHDIRQGTLVTLHIELHDGSKLIMHGEIAHSKEHYLGLSCQPHSEQDRQILKQLIDHLSPLEF